MVLGLYPFFFIITKENRFKICPNVSHENIMESKNTGQVILAKFRQIESFSSSISFDASGLCVIKRNL